MTDEELIAALRSGDDLSTRIAAAARLEALRAQPVRVKALVWEAIDGGNAFRAPALIFGWIRIETYTLHNWQVQWSVPGICNLLMPNVFKSPDEAKAAAQADYERRILSALEPAQVVITDEMVMDALSAWRDHEFDEPAMRDAPRMRLALQAALPPNGGSGDE